MFCDAFAFLKPFKNLKTPNPLPVFNRAGKCASRILAKGYAGGTPLTSAEGYGVTRERRGGCNKDQLICSRKITKMAVISVTAIKILISELSI